MRRARNILLLLTTTLLLSPAAASAGDIQIPTLPSPPVIIEPDPPQPPPARPSPSRPLHLWITREGHTRQAVVPCSPVCPAAEVLRLSRRPTSNCRPLRRPRVIAGAFWQGQRLGPFSNRTTCHLRQWKRVRAIYDRYF